MKNTHIMLILGTTYGGVMPWIPLCVASHIWSSLLQLLLRCCPVIYTWYIMWRTDIFTYIYHTTYIDTFSASQCSKGSRQCNAMPSHWIRQAHAGYYAHASNTDTLRPGTNDAKIFQILFASFVPTLRFFIEKQRKALRVQIFFASFAPGPKERKNKEEERDVRYSMYQQRNAVRRKHCCLCSLF